MGSLGQHHRRQSYLGLGLSAFHAIAPLAMTLVALCPTQSWAAIEGTALVRIGDSWDATIRQINTANGVTVRTIDEASSVGGPCFSPDGRWIAYTRFTYPTRTIVMADNDGTGAEVLCAANSTADIECSWAGNGYIYWSEDNQYVYRASVVTKQRETVVSLSEFTGAVPPRIDNLKVSLDGTRGGCMVNGEGYCTGLDFVAKVAYSYGSGCQGTVSPDGRSLTHSAMSFTQIPAGYSFHQVGLVHDFVSGASTDTFFVPGGAPGQSGTMPRFVFIRFSHSSNNHVVFSGEDLLDGNGYVHDLRTNETVLVGTGKCMPHDFWAGLLPSPPTDGPVLVLDSTALRFVSTGGQTPAPKTITVRNMGTGTLTNVAFQGAPAWLSVTRGGSGNTQTLLNAVSPAGLASGTYTATVPVQGGGATNAANYTVTFDIGSAVVAPSGVTAVQGTGTDCLVSWADNSSNEHGFVVERRIETGTWQAVATRPANSTNYTDPQLQAGAYRYRIRAFLSADSSGWSPEASVVIAPPMSLVVISPRAGDTWTVGSTQHVQWQAANVGNVQIAVSYDAGETWQLLVSAIISADDPAYGNYPLVVVETLSSAAVIRVERYGDAVTFALSGTFSVAGRSAALSVPAAPRVSPAGIARPAYLLDGRRTPTGAGTPQGLGWQQYRGQFMVR